MLLQILLKPERHRFDRNDVELAGLNGGAITKQELRSILNHAAHAPSNEIVILTRDPWFSGQVEGSAMYWACKVTTFNIADTIIHIFCH